MFGGFGQNQTATTGGGGLNFGTTGATSSTSTGFSFGGTGTNTTSGAPTGFSFGATNAAATTAATGGFSFGGTAQSAAQTTQAGFSGFGGTGNPSAVATTASLATTTSQLAAGLSGFNFGQAATKPVASSAPTQGFNFGLGQPGVPASQAPGASGFSFGASTQTTAIASAAAGAAAPINTSAAGGIFGLKAPASTAVTTASAPAGLGGFSGFGTPASTAAGGSVLGGLLAGTSSSATTTSATAPAVGGFSLGTTPASSAATSGFSLSSAATTQTSAAPALKAGLSLGFGTSSAAQSLATTTSSTAVSAASGVASLGAGPQKQMTFRQLEDTINKWTTELEDQERYFLDQATQVNAWDRIVMENGEKIIQLSQDVEQVKQDQQKLDHELDFVRSQQKELGDLLEPLEKALDTLPPISHQQHAHLEREHTYLLAESLDTQLKRMGQDLKEIVERLNSNASKPDSSDPVQQITKILNAHVVSLMWVDRNSADLQRRVEDIAKLMESEKREQERNFRLAYS